MRRRTLISLLFVLAIGIAAASTGAAASHRAAAARVMPAIGNVSGNPEISTPQSAEPGSSDAFDCQSFALGTGDGRCYSPQQIQQAYGYSGLLASGIDGTGETIVIVDAFDSPYVADDLKIQDAAFGLPKANLKIVAPQGVPKFDPNNGDMISWAVETSLDVLWAHAMAPGANLVLVESKTDVDTDMLAATKWAVDNNTGNVISQSFGEAEQCASSSLISQEHSIFQSAVAKGITLIASTGDSGASQFNCDGSAAILAVGSPASDPLVTAVGGTTLNASDPAGNYIGETAWTEIYLCNPPDGDDVNCSGGGYSTLYGLPAFQQSAVQGSSRGIPDVAYNAGLDGGVLTHCGICNVLFGFKPKDPIFFTIGGTSAGSPQWAGLTADAAQMAGHSLGNINPTLYQLAGQPASYASDFHDVTTGSNRVADLGDAGYDAGTGWDPVTGLGSPNAAGLLPAIASAKACYVANLNGPLNVSPGQVVCLQPGSVVHGPVTINAAASVAITGATITGPVTITNSGPVEFDNNTVTGPLTFKGNASVHQSGNQVSGPIKIG